MALSPGAAVKNKSANIEPVRTPISNLLFITTPSILFPLWRNYIAPMRAETVRSDATRSRDLQHNRIELLQCNNG